MPNKFTITKRGYDIKEVDEHLEKLENELVDYKKKETAISKSLITAQVKAEDILSDAEGKARKMIDDVQGEIGQELDAVEKMISGERKALDDFCQEYDNIVKYYFTGNAADITAPLREKIDMLEAIVKEIRAGKRAEDCCADSEESEDEGAESEKISEQPLEKESSITV